MYEILGLKTLPSLVGDPCPAGERDDNNNDEYAILPLSPNYYKKTINDTSAMYCAIAAL